MFAVERDGFVAPIHDVVFVSVELSELTTFEKQPPSVASTRDFPVKANESWSIVGFDSPSRNNSVTQKRKVKDVILADPIRKGEAGDFPEVFGGDEVWSVGLSVQKVRFDFLN